MSSSVALLLLPVCVVCAVVAVLVVALMRYHRCPTATTLLTCCPDKSDCCPDHCPDSLFQQNVHNASQVSLNSKEEAPKQHTPSATSIGSSFFSIKRQDEATPPSQNMYRTQYKRVSIRPPSSDESDDEKGDDSLFGKDKTHESKSNVFQFPQQPNAGSTIVETHPVKPVFTSGIPVQNSPPVPPTHLRPRADGQEDVETSGGGSRHHHSKSNAPSSPFLGRVQNPKLDCRDSFGSLRILLSHDTTVDQMTLTIVDFSSESPECDIVKDGCRVTLTVIPEKRFKFKTSIVKGKFPISWKKSFTFSVGNQIDILNTSLRFRVYAIESLLSKSSLVCQRIVRLEDFPLEQYSSASLSRNPKAPLVLDVFTPTEGDEHDWTSSLHPRSGHTRGSSRSSSVSRVSSDDGGADVSVGSSQLNPAVQGVAKIPASILLGLAYNFNTGRLIVEIHRAANLKISGSGAPDSFVTVAMSSKSERKTSMKKSNSSPVFMENFVFEVAMTHLTLCFVKVIVFVKVNRIKRKLGGVQLALNSANEEVRNHWKQMMHGEGASIVKWYDLTDI